MLVNREQTLYTPENIKYMQHKNQKLGKEEVRSSISTTHLIFQTRDLISNIQN